MNGLIELLVIFGFVAIIIISTILWVVKFKKIFKKIYIWHLASLTEELSDEQEYLVEHKQSVEAKNNIAKIKTHLSELKSILESKK